MKMYQWIVCFVMCTLWMVLYFTTDNVAKSDTYLILSSIYIAAGLVISALKIEED